MKRLGDFYLINDESEYDTFKKEANGKFGVVNPAFRNVPTEFPVLLSYCFTSDLNGFALTLKHVSLQKLKHFIK